ncbi:MAG: DNA polymerase I [Treponema sp.]|jgi:DNA polymerase-1|nr:DNA polymerase I [Treponema sp.]
MSEPTPLFLIDAYGLIYRSYFAFMTHPLRNGQGRNVSVLFGFARTLLSLMDEGVSGISGLMDRGFCLAAAFDSRTPTFRHKIYDKYKATREKAPDDLHDQVPLVEELLEALGVRVLRADGYEADDIIATLATMCRKEKRRCYIISSDKDLLQLVGEGTWELRPRKSSGTGGGTGGGPAYELVGPDEVKAEWGVSAAQILDILSLTGDSSDNIPGVKGIGDKTAAKLMARYGSLDGIYYNIAAIEGSTGKKLAEGKENAYFSKKLITLEDNVPLSVKSIDELSAGNLDRSAAAKVLYREGVLQIARRLDKDAGSPAPDQGGTGTDSPVPAGPDTGPEGIPPGAFRPAGIPAGLRGSGTYKTILDMEDLKALLAAGRKQGLMALDFETDSLDAWNAQPIGISLALKPKEAFYVPVAPHARLRDAPPETLLSRDNGSLETSSPEGSSPEVSGPEGPAPFLNPREVRELLAPLLADPSMTIAAHNAKFDYKVSRGWGIPRWNCKIWDTMVAAWLVEPERNNYSLDSLAAYHLDYHDALAYHTVVPKGSAFDAVSLETATRYSAEDVDLCLRMREYLSPILGEGETRGIFENLEMPLLPILAEMEGEGIKIEPNVLKDYGEELGTELVQVENETYRLVGHEFNLGSPKQLQEVLFVERKLKSGKKTKTGYSTDMAVLEELAREDPVPALILRHRTLSKLKSTYVDALVEQADSQGRLHTNFMQTGTATGRLSSKEPNLQNIPVRDEKGRRIRAAFVARPGNLLISADYSQIELVILAHLSGDQNLVSSFQEGKDVHARTASLIFGVDEDKVDSSQRRIAKTINFGVMYGMSAFRLANELDITRTEAAAFIDAYFKTYSGVSRLINELVSKTEQTGYASTILGRRRYIPAINSRNKTEKAAAERVAVNTPIQGSAADIVKTAMLKVDRALGLSHSPAKLLLQVHDELILECPRAEAPTAAELVRKVMEGAVTLSLPLRVSVETGKRWGDFH